MSVINIRRPLPSLRYLIELPNTYTDKDKIKVLQWFLQDKELYLIEGFLVSFSAIFKYVVNKQKR